MVFVADQIQGFTNPRRHRQAEAGGVLQQADAFVGDVEKDRRRPQHPGIPENVHVEDIG